MIKIHNYVLDIIPLYFVIKAKFILQVEHYFFKTVNSLYLRKLYDGVMNQIRIWMIAF